MKSFLIINLFFALSVNVFCQVYTIPSSVILHDLKTGDSVIYYQCHVKEHYREVNTPSGEMITGKPEKYSVTQKFVLIKKETGYVVRSFISPVTVLPNRRFSSLKIRENPTWNFCEESVFPVSDNGLRLLVALEIQGREAMEFDYAVTKYTTSQLIIKHGKFFKQLVIDNGKVISESSLK